MCTVWIPAVKKDAKASGLIDVFRIPKDRFFFVLHCRMQKQAARIIVKSRVKSRGRARVS